MGNLSQTPDRKYSGVQSRLFVQSNAVKISRSKFGFFRRKRSAQNGACALERKNLGAMGTRMTRWTKLEKWPKEMNFGPLN